MTSVLVVFLYPGEPAQLAAGTRGREMGQGGGGGSGGAGQGGAISCLHNIRYFHLFQFYIFSAQF